MSDLDLLESLPSEAIGPRPVKAKRNPWPLVFVILTAVGFLVAGITSNHIQDQRVSSETCQTIMPVGDPQFDSCMANLSR
jgi:hypothetical protein